MLADLVEKRRLEEEELIQQTKKAEAKRKKFKEVIKVLRLN